MFSRFESGGPERASRTARLNEINRVAGLKEAEIIRIGMEKAQALTIV
jgi:hypothetical protein